MDIYGSFSTDIVIWWLLQEIVMKERREVRDHLVRDIKDP